MLTSELTRELVRAADVNRVSSGDVWVYAHQAAQRVEDLERLVARVAELAPSAVETAEAELGVSRAPT